MNRCILFISFLLLAAALPAQEKRRAMRIAVDSGWANNSVNTVIFRKNALTTYKDTQYISFYNQQQYVVIGKRKLGETSWELRQTQYKGNAADAHNCISIMTDGEGYLHIAWDHHGNALNYCRSLSPGSLELGDKLSMTGLNEQRITYPEFHKLPDGNLLFFYRDGASGKGNLVLNKYDCKTKQWTQLHSNLVDGEQQRNAYWQACIDAKGAIHLSWVWRESPDVASNHDMCYAQSTDGGKTWQRSNGKKYELPIREAMAEIACHIAQGSELINQTSVCADENGAPYIATYWREEKDSVPQYHLIYRKNSQWRIANLKFRKTAFSLSGMGTRRIPISRPQVITWKQGRHLRIALVFRDAERGDNVSIAICNKLEKGIWKVSDLDSAPVGSWEPTFDTELWKEKGILDLFVQRTEQLDGEGRANIPPQLISVLEVSLK